MCPTFAPSAIRIRENSLIWATVKPAIKPVLFLYPKAPINIITINGFPINMNAENIIAGAIKFDQSLSGQHAAGPVGAGHGR